MNRAEMFSRVSDQRDPWDILVIGGGATGVGIAVDAASRGYNALLLEQNDFGKGTSSRSTKLVHGGVRYLQQGNVALVMDALKERGILLRNAPHLVRDLSFIVPNYDWWETPFYGIGLKIYDLLARQYSFGTSKLLSNEETLEAIPNLKTEGLRGGVQYYDGQFDDARLLVNLVQTAAEQGATLLNYVEVVGLTRNDEGFVDGVIARDVESGESVRVNARVVVNATGPFADGLRRMDRPGAARIIAPSRGVHLVLDSSFLPRDNAIMVPHTHDGRVMFAIPWYDRTLVGTTDTPVDATPLEPLASAAEIDFILETASHYLAREPSRSDILSVFAGIRPLVAAGDVASTSALSRDHTIEISQSGMVTVVGGKWTTYRHMAEDCVNQAAVLAGLEERPCVTRELNIHGYHRNAEKFGNLSYYGSDAPELADLIRSDPALAEPIHPGLPIQVGQIHWAVQFEMARTLDDFLARRTRALYWDARIAIAMAPRVAEVMAAELGRDPAWQQTQLEHFTALAQGFCV